MAPAELLADLRRRPFEPFRLVVSDGSTYDIHRPELCLVGLSSVTIGLPPDPATPFYETTIKVDCRHLVKQLPLPSTPAPGVNGQSED